MDPFPLKDHPLTPLLDLEGEWVLPHTFSLRAKRRSVRLARALVNEEGKLERLKEMIELLEKWGDIPLPGGIDDAEITQHFLRVLRTLEGDKGKLLEMESFSLPLSDPSFEEMIRITLEWEGDLTNPGLVAGILSALLCPLRQSVGSCFATAPAILVHEEQMGLFLKDMREILYQGRVTRVFGGTEFTVPASPSPGLGNLKKPYQEGDCSFEKALEAVGVEQRKLEGESYLDVLDTLLLSHFDLRPNDLKLAPTKMDPKLIKIEEMRETRRLAQWNFVAGTDHLLLKVWEFTIASFTDVKTEFSRWNLYSSLGLHPDEKGGIGELIHRYLQEKLDEANEKLAKFQTDYEIAFDQVRATERLMGNASTEQDVRRLKAELQMRAFQMRSCEEMRDVWAGRTEKIANFFSYILDAYVGKFPEYFQEVYDADMHEVKGNIYDDSPAGFRLMFKHGRSHVASWTFVYTKEEYIQALTAFFRGVEYPLRDECEWAEGKEEISHLTTAILQHLVGDEFILQAFSRMASAHNVPVTKMTLEDLDQMEKKPWAYTSGGTIPTLLKTYFCREGVLSEEARWVESPLDLLVFLIETFKGLPPFVTDPFLENPRKRMLCTSPTHAFSLFLGQPLFAEGWQDTGFTYTWVRDKVLLPKAKFYKKLKLETDDQVALVRAAAEKLPLLLGHELEQRVEITHKPVTVQKFYEQLFSHLPPPLSKLVDTAFYELLPFAPPNKIEDIYTQLGLASPPHCGKMGRLPLHEQLVADLGAQPGVDVHERVLTKMEENGLSPPRALVFADSNWAKYAFTFVVNPGTGELEFWRTDRLGLRGAPMREWEHYLTGETKQKWGLYLYPYEYTGE